MTFWSGPGRPVAGERDAPAVVGDRLRAVLDPDDVRLVERGLGRDPHVGEAVLEERQVVEDVVARRPADHVDAEAGRARRELLGQLGNGVHRVLSVELAVAATGTGAGAFDPAVGERPAGGLEVLADGRLGARGVARADGIEDRAVELGHELAVGAADRHVDVGPRVRLERAPDPAQRAVAGPVDEVRVEGRVRGRLADRVAVGGAAEHLVEQRHEAWCASASSPGMASRAASASSSARMTYASSSSSSDGRRTRAPRNGEISTTPSASRSRSASRTGAWLVPSSRATRVSTIRDPGGYVPSRMPSSSRSLTASESTPRTIAVSAPIAVSPAVRRAPRPRAAPRRRRRLARGP